MPRPATQVCCVDQEATGPLSKLWCASSAMCSSRAVVCRRMSARVALACKNYAVRSRKLPIDRVANQDVREPYRTPMAEAARLGCLPQCFIHCGEHMIDWLAARELQAAQCTHAPATEAASSTSRTFRGKPERASPAPSRGRCGNVKPDGSDAPYPRAAINCESAATKSGCPPSP